MKFLQEFLNRWYLPTFVAVTEEVRAKRVKDCQKLFLQRFDEIDELPPSPGFDPDFLDCLHEVHDRSFFETEAYFSFLVNYGAYQLLFLLANERIEKQR